jgi:hypothetical protein
MYDGELSNMARLVPRWRNYSKDHNMKNAAVIVSCIGLLIGCALSSNVSAQEDKAVAEGLPEHIIYLYTNKPPSGPAGALRQVDASQRHWEKGRVLRVCLFNGNPSVAMLIRQVASEWNAYSSVTFDFGPAGSWYDCLSTANGFFQVRIGFSDQGYWSLVGTDSDTMIDTVMPSMNFAHFNRIYTANRYPPEVVTAKADAYHKSVIRHEFGHALGFLHEHQNPNLDCKDEIKWSGPGNVYDYYAQDPNKWDKDQVDRNIGFIWLADKDFHPDDPDTKSIMMYALNMAIFKSGADSKCYVAINYELSPKDKAVIAKIYPKSNAPQAVSDTNIVNTNLRPLSSASSAPVKDDYSARIVSDLESSDTFTRRDARARLADLLSMDKTGALAGKLIGKMDHASYRYRLGLSVAIAKAQKSLNVSAPALETLKTQAQSATDATLKSFSLLAVKNVKVLD